MGLVLTVPPTTHIHTQIHACIFFYISEVMLRISLYVRHILLYVLSVIIWGNDIRVLAWEWSSGGTDPGREVGQEEGLQR